MSNNSSQTGNKEAKGLSYGNFADPIGLVWRMLSKGGRIGRSTLAIEALSKLVTPLDWMLSGKEKRLRESASETELPLVLIVGPPRSGTTLIYQVLAQHWDVSYFTNRNAMFPRSPVMAAKLFERSFTPPNSRNQARNYNSLYGNTAGLSGPNDGFHVWNQFFGEDRYEIPVQLPQELQTNMHQFFAAWLTVTGKPLLNKNNRNTVCFATLAKALPNARFLVVERHPWFVAQSLIKARKWVQGSKKLGWGLGAESVPHGSDHLSYVDAVCRQIANHQKQLRAQVQDIQPERFLHTTYEAFCARPAEFLEQSLSWLPSLRLREGWSLEALGSFKCSDQWSLPEETVERVKSLLPEGDFSMSSLQGPHFSQSPSVAGEETARH